MTQKKTNKTYNIVQIIFMLITMSWQAMSTRQTASRKNRLCATFRDGHSVRITSKFQYLSCLVWFIISLVNLAIALLGPAFKGLLYGSATFHKYLYQGTEAHDMLAGIIYDLNTGIKEFLIETTRIGKFLNAIADFNFAQAMVIFGCCVLLAASVYFVYYTYRQFKWHTRHAMYQ